ncbi:nitrogen assimilation transcription factor nit-4 [Ilyonectria destructans]|nr:nitrogen assimilation transcription factor nit-4 [Ilyonectria destructans]
MDNPHERDPLSEVTGLIGRLNVSDDGQLHYFGSQSNYHLLRGQLGNITRESSLLMQQQGIAATTQLGKAHSIPPDLQNHLLDLYWRWQNPWNHVIHKEAFLRDFHQKGDGKYCTELLLSAIFALASRYSDRPELRSIPDDPSTAGQGFLTQSKILLLYESEAPTVTTVQAACLMALRTMSDNKEALGWLYCGNATRMAFNLGLHLDCSRELAAGYITELEAEVRKVTWWSCYNLDKLFAVALGRPGCTRTSQVTCPQPTIYRHEYEPWPSALAVEQPLLSDPAHTPSAGHCISEILTIACDAMDEIYAPNSGLSWREIEHIIAKTDVALRAYYVTMPSYLRLPTSPRTLTLPHIYLLHIQYHVQLILLHRPLLHMRRAESENSLSTDRVPNSHREICTHSAAEITKLLRTYKQHFTLRTIPIVAVHNAFTAAVIHLIDVLPGHQPHRGQSLRHLQICVDALQEMNPAWCAWSSRALRAIRLLAQEWRALDSVELQVDHLSFGEAKNQQQYAEKLQAGAVSGTQGQSLPSSNEGNVTILEQTDTQGSGEEPFTEPELLSPAVPDDLGFLFDIPAPEGMDALVKGWLADNGYNNAL